MNFITKHIKGISIFLFAAAVVAGAAYFTLTKPHSYTFYAFDTFVNLKLYGRGSDKAAKAAESLLLELENELSLYRKKSTTEKINSAPVGEPVAISDEYRKILERAFEISEKSGGAFDITVYPSVELWDVKNRTYPPSDAEIKAAAAKIGYKKLVLTADGVVKTDDVKIDLGGIAKGYGGDRVKELLMEKGIKRGIINMGGNVCTINEKNRKEGWRVGICDPFDISKVITHEEVRDMSVVTSGAYQRYFEYEGVKYHHIISPFNGKPAESDLASVTVICEDGLSGDAVSTAVFVMGSEKGGKLIEEMNLEAIFVKKDGEIVKFRRNSN